MAVKPEDDLISERAAALDDLRALKSRGASAYELGEFFRRLLSRGVWDSQASIAKAFDVSKSQVSKAIAMTKFPPELVSAFPDPRWITLRIADALSDAIRLQSAEAVVAKVMQAKIRGYTTPEDLIECICAPKMGASHSSEVTVRLTRNKDAFRIEVPRLDRYTHRIAKLQAVLASAFKAFEESVQREIAHESMVWTQEARRRARLKNQSADGVDSVSSGDPY
ncbi:hypothetical protein A6456_22305 [Paraburkholderia tropica]|nr:hypothetical protein A6456_22305 [Paraburkholderia tropica]